MALEVKAMDCRLQIQFQVGENENGTKITRSRSFGRIKPGVDDQDLYETAGVLIGLQSYPALMIRRASQKDYITV